MKSIQTIISVISVLIFLLICCLENAFSTPMVTIGSANIMAGGETSLNIILGNGNQAYAGLNIQIMLPIGLSVKNVQQGQLLSPNFLLHWRVYSYENTNYLTIIAYSGIDQISESEGIIATIVLMANRTVCPGKIPVSFSEDQNNANCHHALSNADGSLSVSHNIASGFVRVEGFVFGDLNADEMVNLYDAVFALKVLCRLNIDNIIDNADI